MDVSSIATACTAFSGVDAIAPFYDRSLDMRVFEARGRWLDLAQQAVETAADAEQLEAIRQQAAAQLVNMRCRFDHFAPPPEGWRLVDGSYWING